MKLSTPVSMLAFVASSAAYSFSGGYGCGLPRNAAFRAKMRDMNPKQQVEYRQKQSEFVDRAFDALANDIQKSRMDPSFVRKQKEFLEKSVEFFTDLGSFNRDDAENLRDITNKGFEIAQDIVSGVYSPAYGIQDTDANIEVSLDLPGVARDDIDIFFEGDILKVSGSRNVGKGEEAKSVPFSRVFPVDEAADTDNISASLDSGVLTIRIPKKQAEKLPGRRVDIQ